MIVKFSDYVLYKEFAGGNNPVGNNQGNANQNAQGQGGQGQLNHPLGSHPVPSPVTPPTEEALEPEIEEIFKKINMPQQLKTSLVKAIKFIQNHQVTQNSAAQIITQLVNSLAKSSNISQSKIRTAVQQQNQVQ